jgi:hypothetical protein
MFWIPVFLIAIFVYFIAICISAIVGIRRKIMRRW